MFYLPNGICCRIIVVVDLNDGEHQNYTAAEESLKQAYLEEHVDLPDGVLKVLHSRYVPGMNEAD